MSGIDWIETQDEIDTYFTIRRVSLPRRIEFWRDVKKRAFTTEQAERYAVQFADSMAKRQEFI